MADTTPVAGATRYLCPLPDCGWYHDSPPLGLADVSGLRPAPGAVGIRDVVGSVAEQALQRRMQSVEAAVRGHLESHLLEDWARALVASQADVQRLRGQVQEQIDAKIGVAGQWGNALVDKAQAEVKVARVRQMVDAWEQRLPETIRTATVVDVIRTALGEEA